MSIPSHRFVSPPLRARRLARTSAALTLLALLNSTAHAVDFYKKNNTTNLNGTVSTVAPIDTTSTSWETFAGGAINPAPVNTTTSPDSWYWDSRVQILVGTPPAAPAFFNMGNDLGVRNIIIQNPGYPIVIDGGGNRTLTVANGGSIDLSAATQNLTLQNLNASTTVTNVGLRLPGSGAVLNLLVPPARTLTVNSNVSVQGAATVGGATVNVSGGGRVVFNAAFRPSNLVINAGTVELNNSAGSTRNASVHTTVVGDGTNPATLVIRNTSGSATGASPITLNNLATFTGAGAASGVVTANSGSNLVPGDNGTGTLSIGSLILATGSKIAWEASSSAADRLAVTATNGLTINGGTIYLHNAGTTDPLTVTGEFTLISYSGNLTGSVANLSIAEETKTPGLVYTLSDTGSAIKLEVSDGVVTPIDWATDASGNWSTGANWTGGVAPGAAKAIARITGETGAALTAPRTVTLDDSRTVGKLYLDASQPVTLAGPGVLTFDQGTGSPLLVASHANHVVSAPLALISTGLSTTVDGATTLTLSGVISGLGSELGKAGTGTLLLTADNTYTGKTTSVGTLQIGAGGTTGAITGPIENNGVLRINRSGALTLPAAITGTGSVEFIGSGTTTLGAANTYAGPTTLSAGSLVLANSEALKNTTLTYSVTGGSLTVADPVAAVTIGALAGNRAFPLTNTIGTPLALTVGGNNDGAIYSAIPVGTGESFTKTGSGTLNLTGAGTHAYTGNVVVSNGLLSLDAGSITAAAFNVGTGSAARLLVNTGTTVTASAASSINNNTGGITVAAGGTANFNGGIVNPYAETTNAFISVAGVLNAASISLGRGNVTLAAEPASAPNNSGLYINGGTVNITGALSLGPTTNSSVSARIDAGSLTVGGPLTVGVVNGLTSGVSNTRGSVLDVNGGTVTSTDTTTGLLLSGNGNGPGHSYASLLVRNSGAVVNVQRVQFGQGSIPGGAYINLSAGSLYVGSGGLVLGSSAPSGATADAFNPVIRLNGGTLGATADWSSTVPVNIQGAPAIVSGASAGNAPHTITLHGMVSGLGSLTKNGAGTVLFTSPSGNFQGPTLVESGTLGLSGQTVDSLTVNAGARFISLGSFKSEYGNIEVQGTLAIGYSVAGSTATVGRIETLDPLSSINLGASSTLELSGTGAIPAGTYVIAKAPVITGSFAPANVNLPAGVTLNQAYDDDANAATPPVIALVVSNMASPYDTWAASYSLSGGNAQTTADPDADGMNNLLEYALDTDPTIGDPASAYTVARNGGNRLTLTFDHAGDSSLTYVVEATNDLTAATWPESTTLPSFTSEGTYTHTDTADLSANPRRFLRLKVTKAP